MSTYVASPLLHHLEAGAKRIPVVLEARRQLRLGKPLRAIGTIDGVPWQTWNKWVVKVRGVAEDALVSAEQLADQHFKKTGRRQEETALNAAEIKAVRANKLLNNFDQNSGSTPEAIFRTMKEGGIRPEICAVLMERHAQGRAIVPPSIADRLFIAQPITHDFRGPRNGWLKYVQSPGSLLMTRDADGTDRLLQTGERWSIDDGTKNFVCCVPLERQGDKCYENFKVIVGRWQFLITGDHRSRFVPGFSHTARPKSSYRAEDLQATMHIAFREHGLPREMVMENGISRAGLLAETLSRVGVKIIHVRSPHQKVVENIFHSLWSKLSFMPGQVGRFMGEEEEINGIIESCKRGATDPRKYFPMLADVLKALHEAINEHNARMVHSGQYGSWAPKELWQREAHHVLRPLNASSAWMFSPTVSDPLLVRGMDVKTTFNVMPGVSLQLNFTCPQFVEFYGARVKFFYNPFEPDCLAKVVLAEEFHGTPANTVLGDAEQINWHTRFSRRHFGIDDAPDTGLLAARRNAQSLHRSSVAIRPDGKPGVQTHEARDGLGNAAKIQVGGLPAEKRIVAPSRRGVSMDEYERQAARLERDADRARRVDEAKTLLAD